MLLVGGGGKFDCSICLTTALAVVSASDGSWRLIWSVFGSEMEPITLHVSISSLSSIERIVSFMSACTVGVGLTTQV